jgi:hemerythrin
LRDERRHDPERLHRIFTEIRKYADFHFVSEQNVMADCAYPGLAEHARLHDELLRNLDDAIEAMHGEPGAYARFVVFLFEWFSYHTINEDRKIAEYIHRPG